MPTRLIRSTADVKFCFWVVGSALDAAFMSSVLDAAVRPTDVFVDVDRADRQATATATNTSASLLPPPQSNQAFLELNRKNPCLSFSLFPASLLLAKFVRRNAHR